MFQFSSKHNVYNSWSISSSISCVYSLVIILTDVQKLCLFWYIRFFYRNHWQAQVPLCVLGLVCMCSICVHSHSIHTGRSPYRQHNALRNVKCRTVFKVSPWPNPFCVYLCCIPAVHLLLGFVVLKKYSHCCSMLLCPLSYVTPLPCHL